jgi:hypothetical protein
VCFVRILMSPWWESKLHGHVSLCTWGSICCKTFQRKKIILIDLWHRKWFHNFRWHQKMIPWCPSHVRYFWLWYVTFSQSRVKDFLANSFPFFLNSSPSWKNYSFMTCYANFWENHCYPSYWNPITSIISPSSTIIGKPQTWALSSCIFSVNSKAMYLLNPCNILMYVVHPIA